MFLFFRLFVGFGLPTCHHATGPTVQINHPCHGYERSKMTQDVTQMSLLPYVMSAKYFTSLMFLRWKINILSQILKKRHSWPNYEAKVMIFTVGLLVYNLQVFKKSINPSGYFTWIRFMSSFTHIYCWLLQNKSMRWCFQHLVNLFCKNLSEYSIYRIYFI